MPEKVVKGRQPLALAIDLSFAAASYPVAAAEETSNGRVWGMKASSRLTGRAAVVGLESGPRSTSQTARPAWGLLRSPSGPGAGDLPLLNAFKGAILASKPAGAS
jgi:hypothetical protein